MRAVHALPLVVVVAGALAAGEAGAGPIEQGRLGILAHDVNNLGDGDKETGADLEFELLFRKCRCLRFLGSPRVQATFAWNTAGDTNFGGAGFSWDRPFGRRWYGELQLGLAAHDGVVDLPPGPAGEVEKQNRLILGSRVLFRWSLAVGRQVGEHWNVAAEFVHLSNGDVLGSGDLNEGINAAGLRIGRRFD